MTTRSERFLAAAATAAALTAAVLMAAPAEAQTGGDAPEAEQNPPVSVTATTTATATATVTAAEAVDADPAQVGAWSELGDWPLVAIHAAVLDDGTVLSYRGTGDSLEIDLWDPTLGLGPDSHTTFNNSLGTNLFCTFTLDDPNSEQKLLVGGETSNAGDPPTSVASFQSGDGADGLADFDAMNEPRWYPTVTTLWDGRLVVQGGTPNNFDGRFDPTTVAEVYSPDEGWQLLEGTRDPGVWATENYGWWYPKSFVTPWGAVWNLAWDQMYYLDPDGQGSIDLIGTFDGSNRGGSSTTVMFDSGKVLQVGGGERGSDDTRFVGSQAATVFDLRYDPPLAIEASPMNFGRHWADATVLPDGQVLVTGGSLVNNLLIGPAYTPELWDPETDTWTTLAPNTTPRLYHSTTLLLPDGSILTAGGGKNGPVDNFNGELFYPPYLFDADGQFADQPGIASAPGVVDYQSTFTVTVQPQDDGADPVIDRVTFIKQSNSTHSTNTQIFQELTFTQSGNTLSVDSPDLATVATPGEYLLFVLDDDGVPSEAATVRLTGTGATPPPPLNGAATVAGIVEELGADPVEGVAIDLFEATGSGGRGQYLASTTTDSDGRYRFDRDPGCYVATFIAPSGRTFTNNSQWLEVGYCADSGEIVTVDAVLNPAVGGDPVIGGTVLNAGTDPVSVDLFAAAADGSRGQYLASTTTDGDDEYSFTVDPGCYVMTFIAPPGRTFTNGSQWFQPGACVELGQIVDIDAELVVGSGDATIEGTVVRDEAGPVGGVAIDIFEMAADGSRGPYLETMVTDENGTAQAIGPSGCYVLTFIAPAGDTFLGGSPWFQGGLCLDPGQRDGLQATLSP